MSYQDPRDQYYNNVSGNQSESYADEYQEQLTRNSTNPRMLEIRGYRPNRNPYSTPNSNTRGYSSTPRNRAADDDDNESVVSSIYSQPSVAGNNYYQEQSIPRRRSLLYNDPPSPLAVSTNTHNSAAGGSSQQLIDQNEKNYIIDNMEENHYRDFSQNTQPQFNVYNDFNNHNFQNDETYDEEGSRHDTLTEPEGAYNPNPYADYTDKFPNEKGARQSMTGEHYVVNKGRRCALCSRKICVIITFVILVLLAIGLYFVWPRIPTVQILSPTPDGEPEVTLNPAVAKMNMNMQIELDNGENWLPYKFNSFDVEVFDALNIGSNIPIATGNKKAFSIPGRTKTIVSIPISIDYVSSTPNDPILQNFINACTKPPNGGQKSSLNVRIDMKLSIFGIDWVKKPSISKPDANFQCPFEATRPSPDGQPTPPAEQPATPAPPAGQPATPTPQPAPPAATPTPQPAPPAATPAPPAGQPATPAPQPAPPAATPTPPAGQPATPAPQPAPPAAAPAAPAPSAPPAAATPAPGVGVPGGGTGGDGGDGGNDGQ